MIPDKRRIYDLNGYYRPGQESTGGEIFRDVWSSGIDFKDVGGGRWQGSSRDIFTDLFEEEGPGQAHIIPEEGRIWNIS